MSDAWKLYATDRGYRDALITAIDGARQRVLLETMTLDSLGGMACVIEAIQRARGRGVEVRIVYDRYAYFALITGGRAQAAWDLRRLLRELKRSGVTLYKVGHWRLNPFARRHHAKAVIADGIAFVGGGANLSGDMFASRDFMLQIESSSLAGALYEVLPRAAVSRDRDQIVCEGEAYRVLLDAGRPGQSIIYDTACELVGRATRVWYVSKLAPDGRLGELLQGKDTLYWHNTVHTASQFDRIAIWLDARRQPVDNRYRFSQLLHAKLLICQLPDGHYETLSGSHNFNSRGVRFGTQELALHSRDQALAAQLLTFVRELDV